MQPRITMKKPCDECPFRKNSLPGWLGPWEALGLHRYVMDSEKPFSCHMTIRDKVDLVSGEETTTSVENTELCVGSILYMNKGGKLARDPFLAEQQDRFEKDSTEDILSVKQFLEHHKDAGTEQEIE